MFGGAVTAVALARAEKRRLCNATMAATERHGQRSRQTERPEDLASLQPGVAGMVSGSPGALLASKRFRIMAVSTSMGLGASGNKKGQETHRPLHAHCRGHGCCRCADSLPGPARIAARPLGTGAASPPRGGYFLSI